MDDVKVIAFNPQLKANKKTKCKNASVKKEKRDRVITKTTKWTLKDSDYEVETQTRMLTEIKEESNTNKTKTYLYSEISKKLNSYKQQDIKKKKYDENAFIKINEVIDKILACDLLCFYCTNPVQVWYKQSRENAQWTLERIDNNYGHNNNNVVISCLLCNIRRRCMYHEKYRFTKQIQISRIEENSEKTYKEET